MFVKCLAGPLRCPCVKVTLQLHVRSNCKKKKTPPPQAKSSFDKISGCPISEPLLWPPKPTYFLRFLSQLWNWAPAALLCAGLLFTVFGLP